MHTRRLIIALVAGGLIGSGITLGVEKLREPEYTLTSASYGGSSFDEAETGKSYTFDGGTVCVSGAYAKITAVRPRNPDGGITVSGFKVVEDETMLDPPVSLVTTTCVLNSDAGERLFVDVRADKLPASAEGFIIEYVIDGKKKSTFNTNYGRLCDNDPKLPENPSCDGF